MTYHWLHKLAARWFPNSARGKVSGRTAKRRTYRPTFELLETRSMPAGTTLTWLGATGTSWSVASNWSPSGGSDTVPGAGDNLVFNDASLTGAKNFTSTNDIGPLALGTVTITDSAGTGFTIGENSGNNITLSGNLTHTSASGITDTVSLNIGGGASLLQQGNGTLVLSGNETYSGGATISGGTLQQGSATALGSGAVAVNSGGTLDLNGQTISQSSIAMHGALINSSATAVTVSATLNATAGDSLTFGGAGNLTLSGAVKASNPFNATWNGASTLILSGTADNSFLQMTASSGTVVLDKSGASARSANFMTVSGAMVQIGPDTSGNQIFNTLTVNSGTFDVNSQNESQGTTILVGGSITGTTGTLTDTIGAYDVRSGTVSAVLGGTVGLTKSTSGTVSLSGNNTYSGGTIVSGGTLLTGSATALGATSGAVSVASGGVLDLDGQSLGNYSLTLSGNGAGAGALTNSSATAASLSGSISNLNSFSVGGTGNITLSGAVGNGNNGTTTKVGNNTLTLSGTADNGNLLLIVTAGTVVLAKTSSSSVHAVSVLTISGGTAQLAGSGGDQIYDLNGVTVNSGTFDLNGQSETIDTLSGNGTVDDVSGAGSSALTVGINNGSSTFSGVIKNTTGAVSLIKSGNGTLTLTGNNSYSGGTTISQGTLVVGSNTALGSGNITMNGGALQASGSGQTLANPVILANGTTSTFTSASGGDLALNGNLSGSGNVTKNGTFSMDLAGADNSQFSGTFTVTQSGLGFRSSGAGSANADWVINGGTFCFMQGSGFTVQLGSLSGSGPLAGTAGVCTFVIGGDNKSTSFGGSINNGSGPCSLNKVGTGSLTLAGASGYSGGTTILGGTLSISADNNLGSVPGNATPGSIVLNGGTLQATGNITLSSNRGIALGPSSGSGGGSIDVTGNNTLSYGGIIANNGNGTGSLTKTDTGTLVLSGNNTYSGGTTISLGTLKLQGGAFWTTAGNYTIAANAVLNLDGNTGVALGNTTISGNGTLRITGGTFANESPNNPHGGGRNINMNLGSGALIDVQAGATMLNGGYQNIAWTSNLASLNVDGTFDMWDGQAVSVDALTGSGTVTMTPAGATTTLTLTVGVNNGSGTFSGVIQNPGTVIILVKTGTGTETLSGNNTYSGGTTISQGTLKLQGGAFSTTAGNYTIAANAVLNLDGNTSVATGTTTFSGNGTLRITGGTFTNQVGGGRNINMNLGSGALIDVQAGATMLNGGYQNITWTSNLASLNVDGTFDMWDGQAVSVDALTGSGSITHTVYAANEILTVGVNSGSGTFSGAIQGPLTIALVKTGTGTEILSGNNTYSGATTVNAGKVTFSNQLIPSTAVSIAAGATLEYAVSTGNLFRQQNNVTFTGGGTLLKSGAGEIIFGGPSGSVAWQFSGGALIDVEGGNLTGGSFVQDLWTSNLSDLNVAAGAEFDGVEANVRVSALTGSGTLTTGYPGAGYVTFTIGVNNGSGTFAGIIADGGGAGNLTKVGSGAQTLSGANTYSGTTTISAGTLLIDNNTSSSNFNLNGGTLGGTGSVGPVTDAGPGGFINPGDAGPGTLTVAGATLTPAVTFTAELASGGNDQLTTVGGTLNLGGATLNVALLNGFVPSFGSTFTIVSATAGGTINPQFAGLADGSTFSPTPGVSFQIHYTTGAVTLTTTSFGDTFTGSGSLSPSWQVPPLPQKFKYAYRRHFGFGGFQKNDKAISVGTGFDAAQVVSSSLLNPTFGAYVDASQALAAGLMARLQSNNNAYVAVLTSDGRAQICLFNAATNSLAVLGQTAAGGPTSGTLSFVVSGSNLYLYVNGVLQVSVLNDTSITFAGGVGIFTWGANGSIDSFSVSGS
jgi:autotransporter-associated beta strand protein